MKKIRLLSGFLAFLMVFSTAASLTFLPVSAASTTTTTTTTTTTGEDGTDTIDYMSKVYATADEKLADMTAMVTSEDGRYTLYIDKYSGEIGYHDNTLNQTLFSNPYNLNDVSKSSSTDIKAKLLSQVIIKYLDNDKECYYNSYTEAAEREQIKVKNIKNGIRVEYSIGREETRKLVPKMIEKSRFEEMILANMQGDEFALKKMNAFYTLKDPDDPTLTTRGVKEMQATFPITQKMAVYVFDPYATDRELDLIESYIRKYCPLYTYDELDKDHEMTGYSGSDAAPAQFKMALEYYLEDGSLKVRFPVNGLRFDDTSYSLTSIQVLPYFGCGSYSYKGYLMLPDGSGTLVRFEDFKDDSGKTVTGQIYGQDYAFYEISGEHQESVRLPVYGVVENYQLIKTHIVEVPVDPYYNAFGEYITDDTTRYIQKDYTNEDKGYFAIIEEGEALASISTETGGRTSNFDTVYTTITPRQRDTYDIADAISGAGSALWTVVSKRKYTGNYTIRYTMLNYDEYAKNAGLSEDQYYPTSYMGMVRVYRDYLEKKGILTRLTADDVQSDIPLYIEAFGTIKTTEKILSFPVTVHTPLTTFEDLKTMYERLKEAGITNVNYKLTGFFNGGMWADVPYNANVESNTGGNSGFTDFISYAKENNIGVYPDFDFVWADVSVNNAFSGLKRRQHLIKTMNTKYARYREYSALYQQYTNTPYLAISPAYYSYYYDTFTKNYSKLNPIGISVSTLGQYLNSDFDKKDPYNREDDKEYTVQLFQELKDQYGKVMTEGGNFYTLPYVTDILNVPLDSSEYLNTSETIPFMGMVLHGYMNFTGMAMNNAGDINYQILKSIENGASCYFQLSYRNTSKLKTVEDLTKYYSISFDIWFDDLLSAYNTLNNATKDLQTKLIVNHEFITGERVLTADELAELKAEQERVDAEKAAAEAAAEEQKKIEEEEAALNEQLGLNDKKDEAAAGDANADANATADNTKTDAAAGDTTAEEDPYAGLDELPDSTTTEDTSRTLVDNGKIVKVTYEGGTYFVLNYNNFAVTVDGTEIPALGFVRVN